MGKQLMIKGLGAAAIALAAASCMPSMTQRTANRAVPATYTGPPATAAGDTLNSARQPWRVFFTDPNLVALIDTALQRNQELNIQTQELQIAQYEIQTRKGEYLPQVGIGLRGGIDRPSRYTIEGATEEQVPIRRDIDNPDPLGDLRLAAFASWEVDIWHKLRNARKSAALRYLASVEGRNFTITNLVAEVATSYYELLALDNQLLVTQQNIQIQENALSVVRQQKEAARATELAVQRFEAQVQNSIARQYNIQQQITETENRINFLVGRFPQHVIRNDQVFNELVPNVVRAGIPAQLLANRPDIRQAEQRLAAAQLDVQVARANFYPRLSLDAAVGFESFRPGLLFNAPASMLYSAAGNLVQPLVNRNGIKALYGTANALQIQSAYDYERTILNGYIEVTNQLSNINNLQLRYDAKLKEVQALNQSVRIANSLFKSVRADYTEVLFTQRDALESKFDLIETKMQQLNASVNVYRALGGGWQR